MNLQAFLAAINALEQLMPPVLSLVNTVHPGDNQQANKVNTAMATTSAVLQSVGVAATTFEQLKPAISAIVTAPALSTSAATIPATDTTPGTSSGTITAEAPSAPASADSTTGA